MKHGRVVISGEAAPGTTATPVLALRSITRRYRRRPVLRGLDLTVSRGEIVGLLGPNGSGKTTTLRIAAGYLWPDAGRVALNGLDFSPATPHLRARLGYLPERAPLYDPFTVEAYLGFVAEARGLRGQASRRAIDEAIEACGLGAVRGRVIGQLSKGFRQRAGLAQARLGDTDLLLLDEPTSGLDPLQLIEAREQILAAGRGRAVLFSTHVLQEVAALCTRVVYLHEGRLIDVSMPAGETRDDLERRLMELIAARAEAAA